jgi:hypothetical protein
MNNTLHTPGPWQLTFGENDAAIHNDVTIASINDDALAWEANANLISAAPDLLQVVADYVLLCDLHDYVGAVPDAAREALRKAKGAA